MESKEQRIRKLTSLYYSNPKVQEAIFNFSKNREISPQYFDSFGKRPDSFEYIGDFFGMVKKGATSFHCSEELWKNPLDISTGMSKGEMDNLRVGWDLLIDIDCKWFEYSKLAAKSIISVLKNHNIKNFGLKYSGSKGFHIIVPWKSFPKSMGGEETKNLFPDLPRKIISYIRFKAEEEMKNSVPEDFYSHFKGIKIKEGIKCNNCKEIANELNLVKYLCPKCRRQETKKISTEPDKKLKCPDCSGFFDILDSRKIYECRKCKISSEDEPQNFSRNREIDLFDLMSLDLILVSPRHLFRMPYSLHEKTAMASVVIDEKELLDFQPKNANPLKVEIRNFLPDSKEGEAEKLLKDAVEWYSENIGVREEGERKDFSFNPVRIENLSDKMFPPSIRKILEGVSDGRKRALFILLNLFRSVGMEKDEIERRLNEWNKKNQTPLKDGYIKSQILWSYRNKVVPPPNFDKEYYSAIGVAPSDEEIRYKNPLNYVVKKNSKKNK